MSNIFSGKRIRLSIFGQSHSEAIGMTLEGLPAGMEIDREQLTAFLQRRAPGKSSRSTPRKEEDEPVFVGGIVGEKTCGAPVTALIYNHNRKSGDYDELRFRPRPGHADYPAYVRFGEARDHSGGGQYSGRMTACLCIAGGLVLQELERKGISVRARILSIGGIMDDAPFEETVAERDFPVVDRQRGEEMISAIRMAREEGDSLGGVVECVIEGVPTGTGEPMFDGIENRIAQLVFAIPAVKGIEFGDGFHAADLTGSENNDGFCVRDDEVALTSNHAGGILGGMADGMPICFRTAFKPTPSIAKAQQTVNLKTMETEELKVPGRHDPCIVPRAVPVIEAVAALAVYDLLLTE